MENQIQAYNDFADITKTAPALLIENNARIERAVSAGESLLAKIQKNGMSDDIDQEINDYLGKSKDTLIYLKAERSPITKIITSISKEFTGNEQLLAADRPDTAHFKLQVHRNNFAKEKAEKARKADDERQLKIDQDQEIERLKLSVKEFVTKKYNELVFFTKEGLRTIFNGLTLDEWDDGIKIINDHSEEITLELYRRWVMPYTPIHITQVQKNEVLNLVMGPIREKFNADLQVEIVSMKQEFVGEYTGKKNELIAIRDTNSKTEKVRIQKEADDRETKRISDLAAKKVLEDKRAQDETIAKNKEIEMLSTFKTEQVESNKPKRTGYEIKISGALGYMPIMNFWFEKEGKNCPFDTMDKMTVGRMKKFCEVYAHKFDEKIESPYLKYEEVYAQKAK